MVWLYAKCGSTAVAAIAAVASSDLGDMAADPARGLQGLEGRGGKEGEPQGSKSETAEEVIALGPRGIFQTTLERDPVAAVWEERRPGSRGDDWRESTYMWFASAPRDPQRHGDLTGDRPGGLSPDYDLGWRPREAAAHPLSHVVATH